MFKGKYMDTGIADPHEVLNRHICGFRQYLIDNENARLTFVSANLCEMTGYGKDELEGGDDRYAAIVHPADRQIYDSLKEWLCLHKSARSAEYRLIKKDGGIIYVRDTVNIENVKGQTYGYASLSDITDVKRENENLRFLNDTVPCGMLKYTCEKTPKVTFMNGKMKEIMRIPEPLAGELDYSEIYRESVLYAIPMDYRRRFIHFLKMLDISGKPLSGEITAIRCDGTRVRLFGWITKTTDGDGNEEFQSVCMDITDKYHLRRNTETQRFVKAISDVYDKIYEYDLHNRTVRYVWGNTVTFEKIKHYNMQMDDATEEWIRRRVVKEDRDAVRKFFAVVLQSGSSIKRFSPPQIRYGHISAEGEVHKFTGTMLKIDTDLLLFCCKREFDSELDRLRNQNISLQNRNENMQEVIMRYTDGAAAFEVMGDMVTPLYSSDNVCEFFGFTKGEWLGLMKERTTLKEFVMRSSVDYTHFRELLDTGEAEFIYYDVTSGEEKHIKAICSQQHSDGNSPRYVLLYKMAQSNVRREGAPKVFIRTFGYFDVFIDGKPMVFRNKKAKELLALLVDRRGGFITSEEAIGYLWENETANTVTMARYRKEALRLKNALEEYGIDDIMESVDGKRRIVPERVECDLYNYLAQKDAVKPLFKGHYLSNYSWGEVTLGELTHSQENKPPVQGT